MPAAPKPWKLWKAAVAGAAVAALSCEPGIRDGTLTLGYVLFGAVFWPIVAMGFVAWRNKIVSRAP